MTGAQGKRQCFMQSDPGKGTKTGLLASSKFPVVIVGMEKRKY
jgi:hypothetical protein